jgi:hypothetical protein
MRRKKCTEVCLHELYVCTDWLAFHVDENVLSWWIGLRFLMFHPYYYPNLQGLLLGLLLACLVVDWYCF